MFLFFELLNHLISLDLMWFVSLLFANIVWIFMFLAIAHFFFNKVSLPLAFGVVAIYLIASTDFFNSIGWTSIAAGFLALNYVSRIVGTLVASTIESLQNKLSLVNISLFVLTMIAWNVFMA